jgi:hypothetical protein
LSEFNRNEKVCELVLENNENLGNLIEIEIEVKEFKIETGDSVDIYIYDFL